MSGVVNNLGARSGVIGKTVGVGVPSDVVAYRASSASTPSGFSEYTSCRGRMICGMPSGGTDAGTVGTAYTDGQDKSKSIAHSHKLGYGTVWEWVYNHAHPYGTSGTSARNNKINSTQEGSATLATHISDAMSTNTTVATTDILAYIQLMVIKKD